CAHSARTRRAGAPGTGLAERRDACCLLGDHSGVVEVRGSSRLALDLYRRVRPHRQARAAAAALLVAHDISPLGAVDVAMAVGEGVEVLVKVEIVTRPD